MKALPTHGVIMYEMLCLSDISHIINGGGYISIYIYIYIYIGKPRQRETERERETLSVHKPVVLLEFFMSPFKTSRLVPAVVVFILPHILSLLQSETDILT